MELGKFQKLKVVKKTDFGVYLAENMEDADKVLLPAKQVPTETKPGDEIRVFIYRDSEDRLIATVNSPLITMDAPAVLRVKEVTRIGAFLDWGLERDLFLPFKEQTQRVVPGREYLFSLYVDKSDRLAATMKVYKYLRIAGDYEKDDEVDGIIYELSEEYGAFVAIDNEYHGLIPAMEIKERLSVGDRVHGRVTGVREDGKINISIHQKAYLRMDEDAQKIISVIEEYDGVLPYNDKASPEVIYRDFEMSKAAFKRAVGRLFKERKVVITEHNIKIVK